MSCEERAWPNNRLGVSLCIHVFPNGFGRPLQRTRVEEARPLYFCLQMSYNTKGTKMGNYPNKAARDNHANQKNPGTKAWKAARDNRANQMNPNNHKTKGW